MTNLKNASPDRCSQILQAVTRASRAAASIGDLSELLQWTVDLVCTDLGFHAAGLYLLDEAGQWATLSAAHGLGPLKLAEAPVKLAADGDTLIGKAIGQREVRVVADVTAPPEAGRTPYWRQPGTRAEAAVPLLAGEEGYGALAVQSAEAAALTTEAVAALQSIAEGLALAVRTTRAQRANQDLIRRAERRARLLEAANEVGRQVTSILDLERLLPRTVDIICDAYGFYYAGVFLLDDSGRWAVLRAGRGEAGATMVAAGHKLEVGGHSMIGAATRLGEARIALDVGEERVHFKNPLLPDTRSEMALPLAVGNTVLGALTVQSVEERAFSRDDILTLQTMADHLAVAIHNALRLKDLERAQAELLRTRTFEALSAATTQAIHWIGNKALPMTATIARLQSEAAAGPVDPVSLRDDLDLLAESARLIVAVKEQLLGPAREAAPRPALLDDAAWAAAFYAGVPLDALTLTVAPDLPLVLADTTQLTRALGNLFQNAREASAQHITVTIGPAEGGVVLSLADDGGGIPPGMLDKVWAAFVTTKGPTHTGLGLAACLHIISQHDGRIAVSSQLGQGTTFDLWLPAAPELPPAEWPGPAAAVWLVDDDDPWSRFAAQALAAAGRPTVCRTTADGAAQADLILVDEALRAAPAADLLTALQAKGLAGKTVVITTTMNAERTAAYLRAGVKDVVLKPYTLADLQALLAAGPGGSAAAN